MNSLVVAAVAMAAFAIAYFTYGRWLARRIFVVDADAEMPSSQLRDDVDFVPTKKEVIFGHHFTSIAGTGPIVGPAIAVFWGWLPALLWVVIGSIFIGAVHDFSALMISLRNRGQTVGEISGRLINRRARLLFLLILFFALTIVLAIFGLVIATIFQLYPASVLSVWIEIPIAIAIGYWVYRGGGSLLVPSLLALAAMYGAVYVGAYYLPIELPGENPRVTWTLVLMFYCFVASVLPVWVLMQPRDFINSHQLILALALLMAGLVVASLTQQADLVASAPAVADNLPVDAPPLWPFLFITIACGAVSGFHCLVSSGTTSKQVCNEQDAQYVGYGAMLLEGALAVIVILACCAGVGMGKYERIVADGTEQFVLARNATGDPLVGRAAWNARYDTSQGWGAFNKLGPKVGAFVDGGANFLSALRLPHQLGIGVMAVLVASFAATTLDTATRLQRYVVQELGRTLSIPPLENKFAATGFALVLAFLVALIPAFPGAAAGTGGLILWPLFGATNQLLAGLAFLVTVFYLWRRGKPIWFAAIPMVIMMIMPAWAMVWNMLNPSSGWIGGGGREPQYLLLAFGATVLGLQAWMVVEAALLWPRVKGVLEDALPPLPAQTRVEGQS